MAVPDYAKDWPHYRLDPVPDALQKIGELVLARKEFQAASYAEIQLQNAHDRIAQLEAALEVATFGWAVLPDFGEPHCRYCRTLFHGTTPADHAADCPVRVLARS